MSERSIHRVRVALSGETVELPWASRDLLLDPELCNALYDDLQGNPGPTTS
jgi:hypothetical protein